jgi:hypothetical protein
MEVYQDFLLSIRLKPPASRAHTHAFGVWMKWEMDKTGNAGKSRGSGNPVGSIPQTNPVIVFAEESCNNTLDKERKDARKNAG